MESPTSTECSWYWNKINSLKELMQNWESPVFADCSWARKLRAEILHWVEVQIPKGDVHQALSRIDM